MTDVERPESKRSIKLTFKGMCFYIKTCQEKRTAKINQAKKLMDKIRALMELNENADVVNTQLALFIKCYEEALDIHETFMELPLPEDEILTTKTKTFEEKMKSCHAFIEDVKEWLSKAGCPYSQPKELIDAGCVDDGIQPEDSISNVTSVKASSVKSRTTGISKTSATSAARINAEAERAALLKRSEALKRKHHIEAQEERLRREKEQLALETDLAATTARLQVLEMNSSQCGSRRSDGMNSYLERSKAQRSIGLDPLVKAFVPHENDFPAVPDPTTVVRPRQGFADQMYGRPIVPEAPYQEVQTTNGRQMGRILNTQTQSGNNQNDMVSIMQKQNEITALLVQQNVSSVLPPRNLQIFDGDPLQYKSFIRAFENVVEKKTNNPSDCLSFLEQYTRGQPKDLVHSCQHIPPDQGYHRAKSLLAQHFGDEHKIASAYMEKIFNWTPIKGEDVKGLQSFSLFLRGCSNLTEQVMYMRELDLPANMRSIILKLPYKLREKWRNIACDLQERSGQRATFIDLVNFIERQVKIVTDPVFGNIQDPQHPSRPVNVKASCSSQLRQRRKESSYITNVTSVREEAMARPAEHSTTSTYCCLFCLQRNHTLGQCSQFKAKAHREKINFIKDKGICFGCLKVGHTSKDCRSRLDCHVCLQKHPGVLHIERQDKGTSVGQAKPPVSLSSDSTVTFQTCGHIGAGVEDDSTFSIVAVKVRSKLTNKIMQTYAFLDPGSSGTFCTETMAKRLNLRGKKTSILLRTMGQRKVVNAHVLSGLEVSGMGAEDFIELPDVLTQRTIPVSTLNIPRQADIDPWPYLKDVILYDIHASVDLLIGTDAPKVLEPWEVINSQDEGPYAVRTKVGWVINGPLHGGSCRGKSGYSAVTANRISVEHLQEMLVKQYHHDFNEISSEEQIEMSREDIKFMDIVSSTAKLIGGHYCIDLPFRQENLTLPDNRHIAEQRLCSLKRKFDRNSVFKEEYTTFLNEIITQGHAEPVPLDQLIKNNGKVWYIPHHGVYHPQKGKLRVVFDCAASFKGTSLNSQLLQGPDLTNSLIGVLVRFRQEPIAIVADIQSMFHQVHVSNKHVDFLRFLWWPGGDTAQAPQEYRMKVHLFGAASSPSCANYALRRTADDNAEHFPPEVVSTVKNNFYVDDCLRSMASEEEARKMIQDLTALCQKGGFTLSKWVSNSRAVLRSVSEVHRAKDMMELDLDTDQLPVERTLGLQWYVETDQFGFKASVQEQPRTRRGILSVVSSLYDPLGFLAPFSMMAKLLLQELCKRNLGWDEVIPHVLTKQWAGWLEDLHKVARFKIDRCIKPNDFGNPLTIQLHHFSDASEVGYGAVSYLRLERDNKVHVAFMMGKARVAPLKQTTIPRLELTAAVLAVRVDRMLRKELQLRLEKSVFWTDSTTVLKYISNENRRFYTFVANRIAVIREATDIDQWRYVGTKENPADEASRGMRAEDLLNGRRWIMGPDFLYKSKEGWPKLDEDLQVISGTDPEVKRVLTVNAAVKDTDNAMDHLIHYFSSWKRLQVAVAWLLKIKETLVLLGHRRKELYASADLSMDITGCHRQVESQMQSFKATLKGQSLKPQDVTRAELSIIRYVQHQRFKDEITSLQSGVKSISKDSPLYRLDPVMDGEILRVGGRLSKALLPVESKRPAILSKDLHISTLILRHIHQQIGHSGRNYMLSRLMRKYWIINANSAARKVISDCVVCRRHRGRLLEQKMADLPAERVLPDEAPFTHVGIDYFGPIEVKRSRSLLKRYGVLFTCMTSRAVHLEVAYTLDTDSCINSVRRFICRRGPVSTFRSDNGTNFVGASRELKESLTALNHGKIQRAFLQDGIEWRFNTPSASHQGGVWERLIRSVKSVLASVLKQQTLDDEALQTVFCEVEAILNDRPITRASDDSNDLEALTPNHILLLKGKPIMPPGLFDRNDLYVRKRWKQIQYMAELFWKRWILEYLPLMQQRQKWTALRRNLIPGDVVIVADATASRGSWMMGKVLDVRSDVKGVVRSVRLQTKTSILERPVTKLCLLLEAVV